MENASKALIIAASILLGLLLITVFVQVFKAGASVNENYDQTQRTAQLELYNSKFENYNVQENTILDLISVFNLAYSINEYTDYEASSAVSITLKFDGEEFKVLDYDPNPSVFSAAYESMKENGFLYEKNKIKHNTTTMSIYDLVYKPAKQLGINTTDDKEKLTRTYYGPVEYKKRYTAYIKDPSTGKITETNVEEDVKETLTVYKYIFNCTSIEYHNSSGRVKSMVFERNLITDKTSPYYWNKDKYEK